MLNKIQPVFLAHTYIVNISGNDKPYPEQRELINKCNYEHPVYLIKPSWIFMRQLGPVFYLGLSMVSANERRRYVCSVFSHWLRCCSTIDRELKHDKRQQFINMIIPKHTIHIYFQNYLRLSKVLANGRRHFICNPFSHWLHRCSAISMG